MTPLLDYCCLSHAAVEFPGQSIILMPPGSAECLEFPFSFLKFLSCLFPPSWTTSCVGLLLYLLLYDAFTLTRAHHGFAAVQQAVNGVLPAVAVLPAVGQYAHQRKASYLLRVRHIDIYCCTTQNMNQTDRICQVCPE